MTQRDDSRDDFKGQPQQVNLRDGSMWYMASLLPTDVFFAVMKNGCKILVPTKINIKLLENIV